MAQALYIIRQKTTIMKRTYLILILLLSIGFGNQQIFASNDPTSPYLKASSSYNLALGLRFGETSGLTLKYIHENGTGIEGILDVWQDAFRITGLFEITKSLDPRELRFYYGGGGHIGAGPRSSYFIRDNRFIYRYYSGYSAVGIDGIVGIEYKIPQIPLAISFDLKPMVEMNTGGFSYFSLDPGLGIKFCIK